MKKLSIRFVSIKTLYPKKNEFNTSQSSSVAPPFTTEQYTQLLQLLSKHSPGSASLGNHGSNHTAELLAGKRYCFFSYSNSSWVIDSGAGDHITPDLSLLHNVKKVQSLCYISLPNGKQASTTHWLCSSDSRFDSSRCAPYSEFSV